MKRSILIMCCVVGLLVLSIVAQASVNGPLKVTVSNASGKWATWSYNWSGSSYTLPSAYQLKATDGTLLGTIKSLSCSMGSDPFITLNYDFQSVGAASFFVDSGTISFAPITNPQGFATAASTLTAGPNDASFSGNFAGGKAYEATYNGGTLFADLDGPFTAGANTSNTENERNPPGTGFTPIGVPVSSMRAQWNFNISADTGVSGTSRFDIEPVPDAGTFTLALSGVAPLLAGLAIRRRRRA